MNIETRVYRLLSGSTELIALFDEFRGKSLTPENGIWKHDIPEMYRKKELAPFIRINPVYEGDYDYSDDVSMSEEQRVQVSFWCKTDTQAFEIKKKLDEILKPNDFTTYTVNENPRYKDADIDLLINHRKYRFFDWKN
ncbi:hypothetical protein [Enterococcus diestrammenae]|uniref:Phage protein n=1 Tax=Enterococcus diestrammenae TaxID=1155073 RepID=A0ABV0F9G5_9ENTE|nr:hypothetical protein [Enterococcus diestrammenae]KAF1297646.1 hypothetical protein BAU18_06855 [Enterococcus diestrammenae]